MGRFAAAIADATRWGTRLVLMAPTLVAPTLVALTLLASTAAAVAGPALFVARDGDSSVYIFGTVHSLRPDTYWRTPAISGALEASQSLWLETAEAATSTDLVNRLGYSDVPLSERLAGDDLEAVANFALDLGVDFARVDPMRPWLASTTLGAAAMNGDGFTAPGADLSLAREAISTGVTVAGLDDPDVPLQLLAGLPPEAEVALLQTVVQDFTGSDMPHRALIDAWLAGDLRAVEEVGLKPMRAIDERIYDSLIVQRNRNWMPAIEHLMLGAGSHFVAVGVLHVVGDEGLPKLLADLGYSVERVADGG